MIQKKIVILGAPGVGKTSLVRQFIQSIFSETYLTTIGVKVDKKQVTVRGKDADLMLWDVAGSEENFSVPSYYLRGAAGYLIVIDGTRPETVGSGLEFVEQMNRDVGPLPHVFVLNKIDLIDKWRLGDAELGAITGSGHPTVRASAKTGVGVEQAFTHLAEALIP